LARKAKKRKGKTKKEYRGRLRIPIDTVYFAVTVPKQFYREAQHIVLAEGYTNVSDYVRDLMRKDFRERGITVKLEEELEEHLKGAEKEGELEEEAEEEEKPEKQEGKGRYL